MTAVYVPRTVVAGQQLPDLGSQLPQLLGSADGRVDVEGGNHVDEHVPAVPVQAQQLTEKCQGIIALSGRHNPILANFIRSNVGTLKIWIVQASL